MTSKTLKSAIWLTIMASAVAIAAGGPPEGKGRKPPSEATNNLSVPAIMVAGVAGGYTNCGGTTWSDLTAPTGTPLSGYPIDPLASYFVQKVHKWQAQCKTGQGSGAVSAYAAWGDNLGGDAKLRAGSPIRVELVLTESTGSELGFGYTVVKLEPNKLDRESAYGTLAPATAEMMTPVVHDGGARLLITGPDGYEASVNPLKPEINATGKVVYGYQLIAPVPGQYLITFTMPNLTIAGCDVGDCPVGGTSASLTITVGGGGGGGGSKGKPPGAGEGE
jgi:hypothetical protein